MKFFFGPALRSSLAVACTLSFVPIAGAADMVSTPVARTDATESGIIAANLLPAVRPQDDLYQYANGAWLQKTQIPSDHSSWGISDQMTDSARLALREILEGAASRSDPESSKVGTLYASFMDDAQLEIVGLEPIADELRQIDAVSSRQELVVCIAQLGQVGVNVPLTVTVSPDARASTRYAVTVAQSGLGMPDRDYYLKADARFDKDRQLYRAHVERYLQAVSQPDPSRAAAAVIDLERALARAQWSNVRNLDPVKTYNRIELTSLTSRLGDLSWDAFLNSALDGASVDAVVVSQPSYMVTLGHLLRSVSLPTWKAYLKAQLLAARAPYLNHTLADESFAFDGKIIQGTPEQPVRWIRGVQLVDRLMGEASGKLYAARFFPPENKVKVETLVKNILAAYREHVDRLDWMSEKTKVEARLKLKKIHIKVGYPSRWRDYSALVIEPEDLIGNVRRATLFETRRNLAKIGTPVDRDEWQMTPPTVNAYYDAIANEIVFPAGILQPPGYVADADDAFNYGATGATIGHEISHGFDEQGEQFDSDGNLRNWWTAEDHRHYARETQQLVTQYESYEPLAGVHVNGALTLGENIADLAGLEIAYAAYHLSLAGKPAPVIDGFTGDQRFFLGYAQSWLMKQRPEALLAQLTADPHAPEKYRVNGVVIHMPSFYAAFTVKPGDGMYLQPSRRLSLW